MTLAWKRAITLLIAGLLGTLAVIPYQLALLPPLPVPLPLVVISALINSALFIGIAIALGTFLGSRAHLGTPIIDSALADEPVTDRVRRVAGVAIALGLASAVAIVVLEAGVFLPLIPELGGLVSSSPPVWSGLLATLYGAMTEEILLRYGVMSLFAWLFTRVARGPAAYWMAIATAAVLFGLGHLPATAQLLPLTPIVIVRAVVLNGFVGIATGWLYWRRGLEASMIAHGAADIVLHVAVPAVIASA